MSDTASAFGKIAGYLVLLVFFAGSHYGHVRAELLVVGVAALAIGYYPDWRDLR